MTSARRYDAGWAQVAECRGRRARRCPRWSVDSAPAGRVPRAWGGWPLPRARRWRQRFPDVVW